MRWTSHCTWRPTKAWGVAASYADVFGILASNGVIDPALAAALANLATLRNRLAHGYGSVDMERIWLSLPNGLAALDAFASAIAARMGAD
jgi:uncharacterized protein YutE (UPF0331/DUF86 family)